MSPVDTQIAEAIFTLTGYALYVPVIFFLVEALKQWIPETSHKRVLPILSFGIGAVILYVPTVLPSDTVELLYRGALIGAVTTGIVAYKKNSL